MSLNDSARTELVAAINVLVRRRANTTDKKEKTAIDAAIASLNDKITLLNQAGLLQAANAVAAATDDLEKVVAAAKTAPFDGFLGDIEAAIKRLLDLQGQMHGSESLPAADAAVAQPLNAAVAKRMQSNAVSKPINSTAFADLENQYAEYYAASAIQPASADNIAFYVSRLRKNRAVYEATGRDLGIPWYFVGIVHGMECGFNFNAHLHNGDPLSARTVQVPAGRPQAGQPPFTWQESARDAFMLKGYHHETSWTTPRMLYLWEKYNGFGYRRLGVPTPYLWSFTTIYTKGKYTGDHQFDPNAVSKQCGTAGMLKGLGL